jgi:hypothetical protein
MGHVEKSERPKAILYDNAGMTLADFREEIEQVLASSAFEFRVGKEFGGAGAAIPTLELILAFASGAATIVITSALNKLGEDIYNALKSKLFKNPFENDSSMLLVNTIITDERVIIGTIRADNHQLVIEGMRTIKEIVDDASKVNIFEVKQVGNDILRDRDKLVTERCNFVFHYEYDTSAAKWMLKNISRIEKTI